MKYPIFENRSEAGKLLAERIVLGNQDKKVVVVALPRGGVPVAYEIASSLRAPLDLCLVRKLGVPGRRELAMGALASGGYRYLDNELINELGIPGSAVDEIVAIESKELERRAEHYRAYCPERSLKDATVILVDDGLATGASMLVAIKAVRAQRPRKIILAVPVASASSLRELAAEVDEVACLEAAERFYAVGLWYCDFSQTTDEEVVHLLAEANQSAYSSKAATI